MYLYQVKLKKNILFIVLLVAIYHFDISYNNQSYQHCEYVSPYNLLSQLEIPLQMQQLIEEQMEEINRLHQLELPGPEQQLQLKKNPKNIHPLFGKIEPTRNKFIFVGTCIVVIIVIFSVIYHMDNHTLLPSYFYPMFPQLQFIPTPYLSIGNHLCLKTLNQQEASFCNRSVNSGY